MSIVLTPEQTRIVEFPLGPLRVAAGAGTGKTSTMAWRLAAAVQSGIDPEAALGMTFTNKAADELADRLRVELPELAADGRDVDVTTYHGFAYRLLDEYGSLVGVERGTSIIGSGYQRQLILDAMRTGTFSAIDLSFPPGRVAEVATLTRQIGENLLLPDDVVAAAPSEQDQVWEQRLELLWIVAAYRREKQRLGVVDYSDLVRLANVLVSEHRDISLTVRRRYSLVLLDEYQDTDPAQRMLLQAIFGDGFAVTAVGDANQTIYEWRGASLENFSGFSGHFPEPSGEPAPSLPLTLNRRSDRLILDLANRAQTAVGEPGLPLTPAASAGIGEIVVTWHETAVREAQWLADRLRAMHDEEGLAWGEMAVLFRKNRNIAVVRDAVEAQGIPFEVVSLGGLLGVPEVAEVHAWLRILHDADDSAALARLLLGGKYRLGLGDLVPLRSWVRAQGRERAGEDEDLGWPLLEAVDRLEDVTALSEEARRRLERFRAIFRDLLVAAQSLSLVELCRHILDAIDAWAEVDALPDHASLSARLNLYRFLDLAESWSPLEGRPSLEAFLGYLQLLEDDQAAEELDTATVTSEDAVSLLTVHRCKGLEWDVVFLPAVVNGTFPAGSGGFDNPVDYPRYLPYVLRIDGEAFRDVEAAADTAERKDRLRERHEAQEWRTAYVAVTRARHRLFVSGAFWYTGKTAKKPSDLFELAASLPGATVLDLPTEPGPRPEAEGVAPPTDAADPLFPEGWQAALRAEMAAPGALDQLLPDLDFRSSVEQLELELGQLPVPPPQDEDDQVATVSVTGLVMLAGCPRRFHWAQVDRLPQRPTSARRRGVEFHRRVELHNLGVASLEELSGDLYDDAAETEAPSAGPGGFTNYLDSRFSEQRPRFVEVPIDLEVPIEREGGVGRVRGRIDAVYEHAEGDWEIVDFKSGRPRDDEPRWVQLQAYAVAAAEGAVSIDTPDRLTVTFAYFGGEEAAEETIEVDERWLDGARTNLTDLVTQAAAGNRTATPSERCTRCDFLAFCEEGTAFVEGLGRKATAGSSSE